MEKLKCPSQNCTTTKQLYRLLDLGLKANTADMCYVSIKDSYMLSGNSYELESKYEKIVSGLKCIPAWSLHRLMCLCPGLIVHHEYKNDMSLSVNQTGVYYEDCHSYSDKYTECFDRHENIYDNMIDCIEWLIHNKYFDIEYLNEEEKSLPENS